MDVPAFMAPIKAELMNTYQFEQRIKGHGCLLWSEEMKKLEQLKTLCYLP